LREAAELSFCKLLPKLRELGVLLEVWVLQFGCNPPEPEGVAAARSLLCSL
jgi:hypothetical protein